MIVVVVVVRGKNGGEGGGEDGALPGKEGKEGQKRNLVFGQGLLYHRTCKPDFLCSWPSLNSYLK